MKKVFSNPIRKSAHRSLSLRSSTPRDISSLHGCLLCTCLKRDTWDNSIGQRKFNHPFSTELRNSYVSKITTEDDYLESLESEIESWITNTASPSANSKDIASIKPSTFPSQSCDTPLPIPSSNSEQIRSQGNTQNVGDLRAADENKKKDEAGVDQEGALDTIAEEKRREFYSNPDQMPTLSDIEVLKPPRLKRYLPKTPRTWYIDRFEKIARRLMRAFTRPQLEHICRLLGFEQSEEIGLSSNGTRRLKQLKIENPSLSVKDLRAMVLSESNPTYEMKVKKRDPSDTTYTKTDLINFVLVEHWGLTDPKFIPLPINFEKLTHRFQSNYEFYELPYHEIFLLHLEQTRDPERNLISYLSRRSDVNVEFTQDPTTGINVRGEMKARDKFWRAFQRLRRTTHKYVISIPKSLDEVAVTPELLKTMSELAGCYLELTSEGGEERRTLVAYSYHEKSIIDNITDTLTQLEILSGQSNHTSIAICPSSGTHQKLWLCPFLPISKPSWYNMSVADTYSRLTYSRSRTPSVEADKVDLTKVLSLRAGKYVADPRHSSGPLEDLRVWLNDVTPGPDTSSIDIRATFGHYLYPRQSDGSFIGANFGPGDPLTLTNLSSWSSRVIPRPFFLPSFHPLSLDVSLATDMELTPLDAQITEDIGKVATSGGIFTRIYRSPSNQALRVSSDSNWTDSLRVTTLSADKIQTEECCSKSAVIMLPERPMDIMFTVERRSTPKIISSLDEGDQIARLKEHVGKQLVLTDFYECHTTQLPIDKYVPQVSEAIKFTNERRIDSRINRRVDTELRSELAMRYDINKIEEFISISNVLASSHLHGYE